MKKQTVSNRMLIVICVMIILYTGADFVLQYLMQIEISPTLTTAWFAFWGTELVALAAIKTSKLKHGVNQKQDQNEELSENSEGNNEELSGNPEGNVEDVDNDEFSDCK